MLKTLLFFQYSNLKWYNILKLYNMVSLDISRHIFVIMIKEVVFWKYKKQKHLCWSTSDLK